MASTLQQPTVVDAEKILERAYVELRKAKGNRLKRRQAAEKGWLAARTAALALLAAAGEDWKQGEKVAKRVEDLEHALDPRSRVFASALYHAQGLLHGACFYIGYTEACETRSVRSGLEDIRQALPRAKRLCTLARRRNGNGQKKRGR